jgi:hypothetical protein
MGSSTQIVWFRSRHRVKDSGMRRDPPEARTDTALPEQKSRYSEPLSVRTRNVPTFWAVLSNMSGISSALSEVRAHLDRSLRGITLFLLYQIIQLMSIPTYDGMVTAAKHELTGEL